MKYYITTPIYYVNDRPHIGHAYTTIAADTLARFKRLQGYDVIFATGTDDNSEKNAISAKKQNMPTREYVDKMSAVWQQTWVRMGLSVDRFIRTTEDRHIKAVNAFWKLVEAKGDIYRATYNGLYCVGCEAYVGEGDLVNGKCPLHNLEPQKLSEENYFFKLSAYKEKLLAHIAAHPTFIQPESRRNEVVAYITNHLADMSISRKGRDWGIPVPGSTTEVLYVWFDALINYLSVVGFGTDEKNFSNYWPANLHLMGKDIIKFHCALWPAMLLSAGLPLPERVFAHGFFTIDGQKISKSLGNAIDPLELTKRYPLDALRYFLLREITFGEDGDFSETRLKQRYEGELANGIGNLTARILTMAEKYCEGRVPVQQGQALSGANKAWPCQTIWASWAQHLDALAFDKALATIWEFITSCDTMINTEKPWALAKTKAERIPGILYTLLESLRHIALMILPFMPETAEKILTQLGVAEETKKTPLKELQQWGWLKAGTKITKTGNLFPRIEASS